MIRLSSAASTSQLLKPHQGPSSPVLLHSAPILRLPMALPELDSLSDGSQRPRERSASSVCRLCSLPEWKPHPPVQNQNNETFILSSCCTFSDRSCWTCLTCWGCYVSLSFPMNLCIFDFMGSIKYTISPCFASSSVLQRYETP